MTGVIWRCSHFNDYFYTRANNSREYKKRQKSAKPTTKTARTMCYELIIRSGAIKYTPTRKIDPDIFWKSIALCKTKHVPRTRRTSGSDSESDDSIIDLTWTPMDALRTDYQLPYK